MFFVPKIMAIAAAVLIVAAFLNSIIIDPIARHIRKKAEEKRRIDAMVARAEHERKMRKQAAIAQRQAAEAAAMKKLAAERRRIEREQKQAAAHAVKVARATELAELAERRLNAERQRIELRNAPVNRAPDEKPVENIASPSSNATQSFLPPHTGNNVFRNEVVSFTGTLPGMTRREAIAAVEANGGKAYDTMPAATTILVVGDNPGNDKLDKADKWAGAVRKITARQFDIMLRTPLTYEIDELEAFLTNR